MKYCIVSSKITQQAKKNIRLLGYSLRYCNPVSSFSPSVAEHPDLQFFADGEGKLYSLGITDLPFATPQPLIVPLPPKVSGYPAEARINLLRVGNCVFGNSSLIADIIIPKNLKFIHVNQGYANCSSIAIGKEALITDDPSIHVAAVKEGIEVLYCEKGDVRLPGYPYGFIGGAAIHFADGSIGFFGDPKHHRNGSEILAFLEEHGVLFHILQEGELRDYGGGIVIEK